MKKILSLALVLALVLSLVAVGAMAETGVDTNPVEKEGVQYKGTVKIGSVMCETGAVASVGIPYSQFYMFDTSNILQIINGL